MTFSFEAPGTPAPWTAWPKRGKPPVGFQRMKAWQVQLQVRARMAWGARDPLTGPVGLRFAFYMPKKAKGDLTNLVKAAEDALQGILIQNDKQVVHLEAAKTTIDRAEGLTVIWLTVEA